MAHYFAYGSNIDRQRLESRVGPLETDGIPAFLPGYRLCFGKKADRDPTGLAGFASLHKTPGEWVEGVVHSLSGSQLLQLDAFEGHPEHYTRTGVLVEVDGCPIPAETYLANTARIQRGLLPTDAYLSHLRARRGLFSEEYQELLDNWQTVEGLTALSSSGLAPVFVYGTLKKGYKWHATARLNRFPGREALCHGLDLHRGADYPFAVDGQGVAHGEYYVIARSLLDELDEIEGHPRYFRRELRVVRVQGRKTRLAWVYLCDQGTNYPRIENGLWVP